MNDYRLEFEYTQRLQMFPFAPRLDIRQNVDLLALPPAVDEEFERIWPAARRHSLS